MTLPFRTQAGSSASLPQPAGGVIPPFREGADRGPVPAGGEWAPESQGSSESSPSGGANFVPGFTADGDTGAPQQFFEQKAPSGRAK